MYMEIEPEDTQKMLKELLYNAISYFEFPRVNLNNKDDELEEFNMALSRDEINILATYMVVAWLDQQLASIENTRMKYSGSDFKFTSQANHMAKVKVLKDKYMQDGFHLQRLYKRRIEDDETGIYKSTFDTIMASSANAGWRYRPYGL